MTDAQLARELLERIAGDLGMMIQYELNLEKERVERVRSRPAGADRIHASFRLSFSREDGRKEYGALLLPLPDALTMAGMVLMIPKETIATLRKEVSLSDALKDALLELGNFIGGACKTALGKLGLTGWSACFEGCQGVRPDVPPTFPYEEGSELIVARTTTSLQPFPPFDLILMLPVLA